MAKKKSVTKRKSVSSNASVNIHLGKNFSSSEKAPGVLMLVVGLLVLIWPESLRIAIGLTLAILGILALTKK